MTSVIEEEAITIVQHPQPEQPAQQPQQQTTPPVQPAPQPPKGEASSAAPPNKNWKKSVIKVTIVLLILALAWFLYYFFYLQYHEYTDDAYANGNMININTVVPGSVVAFYADDTDLVVEGQLLVELDKTNYQVAYDQELANLAAIVLQVRQYFDNVEVNRAAVESRQVAYDRAKYDFDNRAKLVGSQAVSNEDFTHSKQDLATAKSNLEQSKSQLLAAQSAAGNTKLEEHPQILQQRERVIQAYFNLVHCSVYSPATGYVAQRAVQLGEWVPQSRNLMAVIPTDYVWVDANYKETQLTYMRIGQPARVWLDIYGDVEFKGVVLGIASGSGSVFSLIPPQNATGNWIKIVQRLPVRIGLDPEEIKKYPLRLGISAEVNVDITDFNLPKLAPAPNPRVIGATDIFKLNLDEVNHLMDEIIVKNSAKKPEDGQ